MCPPLSHPFGATSCQPLRWPKGGPVGEAAGGRAARASLGMLLATLHMTHKNTPSRFSRKAGHDRSHPRAVLSPGLSASAARLRSVARALNRRRAHKMAARPSTGTTRPVAFCSPAYRARTKLQPTVYAASRLVRCSTCQRDGSRGPRHRAWATAIARPSPPKLRPSHGDVSPVRPVPIRPRLPMAPTAVRALSHR